MRITATGNLGLGAAVPLGRIHINAPLDGSISSIRIGAGAPGNINVPVGKPTGSYSIDFHTWRDVIPDQVGASIKAERINNFVPNNALVQSMDLTFSTSDGFEQSHLTEKLRIRSDGKVGIGTTSPDQMLTVNGSIHSKEVLVDNNVIPDYVFEKDYKLPTLSEIEKYITANKHLPEIPSAKEMEKEGVKVGDLTIKLLKKMEEMTLIMIQQQKKVNRLERLNYSQQKQLNRLVNRAAVSPKKTS